MSEPANISTDRPRRRFPVAVLQGLGTNARHHRSQLPSRQRIQSPWVVRYSAPALGLVIVVFGLSLLLVPWQQAVLGSGRVIAFAPEERRQTVDAPVAGIIEEWHVQEGDFVERGDPIATLGDNDPDYLVRTISQKDQAQHLVDASLSLVEQYVLKLQAEEAARDLAVAEVEAEVLEARSKLGALEAELDAAAFQEKRITALSQSGIESTRQREIADMNLAKARAAVEAQRQYLVGLKQKMQRTSAAGAARIASTAAQLEDARAKTANARTNLLRAESMVARQRAQTVYAPRDGRIYRLHGGPTAAQLSPGEPIVTLIPSAKSIAVELLFDGNDMPLIQTGEEVRLVFEGWPAVQFSGWPEFSGGTFHGIVQFVDPADNGEGQFRAVVVPDPDGPSWPSAEKLRQGVRAKGFVLLGRVTLGYEIWRQVNAFPPLPPVEEGEKLIPPTRKKPKIPGVLR